MPPHQWISNSFTIFCSELETINTGHLDFTNNSGVQDSLLQVPQAMCKRVTRVKCHSGTHHMDMAIKDLLAKGAIQEVRPQDDQFTSTLFLVQKENGNY